MERGDRGGVQGERWGLPLGQGRVAMGMGELIW